MWVFTQDGFISAVDNGYVPGKLAVRARDKQSLQLLSTVTGEEIIKLTHTDYPYRTHVTKEQFTEFLATHVEDIDYKNFKDRVYTSRGKDFAGACGNVWDAMLDVTDAEARGIGLYS
jgi:hypothetical protein